MRGRGSASKYSGGVNHSDVAPIEGSCSAIGLHLLIEPVTRHGVVERGHAVAIGAGRADAAADAIVEDSEAVSVGSGAAGDAALGVVENARV